VDTFLAHPFDPKKTKKLTGLRKSAKLPVSKAVWRRFQHLHPAYEIENHSVYPNPTPTAQWALSFMATYTILLQTNHYNAIQALRENLLIFAQLSEK
jgi:hypothetical protein